MEANEVMAGWPQESREAAELVIKKYGPPQQVCGSMLVWEKPGPWKRMVAYRDFTPHNFPAPHIDAVESFLEAHVSPDKVSDLARFDGSVVVNRTRGEISARCHDEEANFLALNLADDVITGKRSVDQARAHYAEEFLDYRRKKPTPYMEGLKFRPQGGPDPDRRLLSDQDLRGAAEEGRKKSAA